MSSAFKVLLSYSIEPSESKDAILQNDRQIVDAERPRQTKSSICPIIDNNHSGQAHINLASGVAMRMRMVPKRRGCLIDLQNWTPRTTSVE